MVNFSLIAVIKKISMCEEKRKRSPNWLPSEKLLLTEIVEKHFSVVENKKTDGSSLKAKLAEWKIIAVEYNSQTTNCYREAENLKSQWESMKKAAKKEASHARMRRIQTGGGPPDLKKEDPIYSRIISLITTSAVGLYNPNDGDSAVPVQTDSETITATSSGSEHLPGSCNIDINKIISTDQPMAVTGVIMNGTTTVEMENWGDYTNELHSNDEDMTLTHEIPVQQDFIKKDWGDYTPQLLKTPVSTQLKKGTTNKTGISRRRPLHTKTTTLELLHHKKIEAINLQKAIAVEESERLKTISELDKEIKKEILKQEKLKTKLLLLELRKKRKEYKENLEQQN